ncbi:hypothetical protein [Runella sp.]|uniref:hypothetical protein n=1 Tax=Runella sp. TaxID=1960881 RepID=UPI003D0CC3B1
MIKWLLPSQVPNPQIKAWGELFHQYASQQLIENVRTDFRILSIAERWFLPVSINDAELDNSYVCSPYTACVTYSIEELNRNIRNPFLNKSLNLVLKGTSNWLIRNEINKTIHVNNFLLSTNPYPDWHGIYLPQIVRFLTEQFPGHTIIFRSLNQVQHSLLLREFERYDFRTGASRQVYYFHPNAQTWSRHNNIGNDRRLVQKSDLTYLSPEQMKNHVGQIRGLYNQLYIQKYSQHNPRFTETFFEKAFFNNLFRFEGYCDGEGILKTVVGLFELNGTITSPIVGYDLAEDPKKGLYIYAIDLILKRMHQTGQVLNLSSGAANFKRLRGGQGHLEYSAIYMNHLPPVRQRMWKTLLFLLNKIGIPLLEKYEL